MVADKVEVYTKSMNPDAVGYVWKSEGYLNIFLKSIKKNVYSKVLILEQTFMKYRNLMMLREVQKSLCTSNQIVVNMLLKKQSVQLLTSIVTL